MESHGYLVRDRHQHCEHEYQPADVDQRALQGNDMVVTTTEPSAIPAELCFALLTGHVWATSILLYADIAARTGLADEHLLEV